MMKNRTWIAAALLGMSFAVASPLPGKEGTRTTPAAKPEASKDYDIQVKYATLPDPVKVTVDKARGERELTSCWHVMRAGKEFYRIVIDFKGDDRVIRVQPGGALLSAQDIADLHGAQVKTDAAKALHLGPGETDGVVIDYERAPGQVRTQIGALAKRDAVHEVVRYKFEGKTMYRAQVGEPPHVRYIRVHETGRSAGVRGDVDPGKAIAFDKCPGEVKRKIGSFAKAGKVEEVFEYMRGGKPYYQAQIEDKDGKHRFITVDLAGNEVKELPKP